MKKLIFACIVIFVSCIGLKQHSNKYLYHYQLFPTGYILEIPKDLHLWITVMGDFPSFIFKDKDSSFFYISYSGFFSFNTFNHFNIRYLDSNIDKDSINNITRNIFFNKKSDNTKIEFVGYNTKKNMCKDVFLKSNKNYSHIVASYSEGIYIGYMNVDSNKVEKFNKIINSLIEVELDSIKLNDFILLKWQQNIHL
jgi:hypothetical protein